MIKIYTKQWIYPQILHATFIPFITKYTKSEFELTPKSNPLYNHISIPQIKP